MEHEALAQTNLLALKQNPYPGRGLVVGLDSSFQYLIQAYWIMGRSKNSRNRIFVAESDGLLKTAPADPKSVEDPSLIIYTAMAEDFCNRYAVSNGHQTLDALDPNGLSYLENWQYEPDAPHYTPRISAVIDFLTWPACAEISILRKSPFTARCERSFFTLDLASSGRGYCITTYSGDGNPLPAFRGEPYLLPLKGNIDQVAQNLWESLNEKNRVSLAVKFIDRDSGVSKIKIINKYEAVF